jgi:hypothetical protein
MEKEIRKAAQNLIDWYEGEDQGNPQSTERWTEAYNKLKEALSTPKEEVKELPGEMTKLKSEFYENTIRGDFQNETDLLDIDSAWNWFESKFSTLSPDPSNTIDQNKCIIHNVDKQGICFKCGEEIDGEVTATLRNPYENDTCNYVSYGDYCDPDNCSCKKSYQWKKENQPFSMWIRFDAIKPRIGVEVLAFSKKFIHPDYNPKGIRIGFLNEDDNGPFISAYYNNSQDCYKTCEDIEPELWSYITNFEPSKLNVSTKEKESKGEELVEAKPLEKDLLDIIGRLRPVITEITSIVNHSNASDKSVREQVKVILTKLNKQP